MERHPIELLRQAVGNRAWHEPRAGWRLDRDTLQSGTPYVRLRVYRGDEVLVEVAHPVEDYAAREALRMLMALA